MSKEEKAPEPTLEEVTADRDKYKGEAEAAKRALASVRKALGIDKDDDPVDAIKLLASPETAAPALVKVEENGTRSFGTEATADRFIHVESVDFSQDLGYEPTVVHRRASAAVARALGGKEDKLPALPVFGPERALVVTVEVR